MSPIEPVYLTTGGALFGVTVTLIVQAVLARTARRHDEMSARIARQHDKMTKTYDRKLEIYVDLAKTLTQWAEMRERARDGRQRAFEALRRIQEELTEAQRAKISSLLGQYERSWTEAEESFAVFDRLTEHFRELTWTLPFIADKEVTMSFAAMVERIINNQQPSEMERQRFYMAVRKELGG